MNASTNLPGISCFTSTYGRTWCLEEQIQSFLNQDYQGPKQLVILNDYVEQELVFDHPEVKIINHSERIKPLAAKFNMNVDLCDYDIVAVWEDDDFHLPWHLSYGQKNMKNDVYHAGVAWVHTGRNKPLHYAGNYFHSSHIFTKDLFNTVGKYTISDIDNCALDVSLMSKFNRLIGHYTQKPLPEDISYIYRWGCGSYHGSGWGTKITNMSDLAGQAIESQKKQGIVKTGRIDLKPQWIENYTELAKQATEAFYAATRSD